MAGKSISIAGVSRCPCKGFELLHVGTKLLENLSILFLMLVKQVLKDNL